MRRTLTDEEFANEIFGAQRYAWRWEQQPVYEIGDDKAKLEAFRAGRAEAPTDNPEMVHYLDRVRAMVRDNGVGIGRVRVIDEPRTGYQLWRQWMDWWNQEAGEDIHYLPRRVLQQMGRPPFEPDTDWWLIDGERLLIMQYAQDGSGRRTQVELEDDPAVVIQAVDYRHRAIQLATEGLL